MTPTIGTSATPLIEAISLCKYYGRFAAIEGVSFTVPTGSVTAFLGPNGSGKSTTLRILAGSIAPSSGTARIAGFDQATDRAQASRRIGYLPEQGPLYADMTPAGYLAYCAAMRSIHGDQRTQALRRAMADCRLESVWHKPIRKLSKGFRQRVALAQALLHEPQVLILDEPTSGLDPNQMRLVRDLIRAAAPGRAVLLSTHQLSEVEAMADRVVLLHEGRVVFQGTPAELARDGGAESRFHILTQGVVA